MAVVSAKAEIPEDMPKPQVMNSGTPPPPDGLPIDNGLIILFAIAIIYGIYKVLQHTKKPA